MLNRFYCIILLFFLIPASAAPVAIAQTDRNRDIMSVIAMGSRKISGSNAPAAKNSAVSDALNACVERAVTRILTRSDIINNLGFLYTTVLHNPEKHIVTYKVLAEIKSQGRYMVAVEAKINSSSLKTVFTDYAIINKKNKNPRLLFFITEQVPGEILPKYWWRKNPLPYESAAEDSIVAFLKGEPYEIVGLGPKRPSPENWGVTFEYIHDSDAAIKLGTELKCDVVVMGKAATMEASNRMGNQRSYRATLAMDIFSTATGDRVTTVKTEGIAKHSISSIGSRDALALAGTRSGKALVSVIDKFWSETRRGPRTIEARIEGRDYLSNFIMLRRVLNEMEGIESIFTKELGSDQAVVDIVFQGGAQKLADALMLKTFDSFSIELSEVTETGLAIKFVTQEEGRAIKDSEMERAYISE